MKVILEREKCIGCGSCAALCPKYFEIVDDGKSSIKKAKRDSKTGNDELEIPMAEPSRTRDKVGVNKTECTQEAADSCPVQAIHIVK